MRYGPSDMSMLPWPKPVAEPDGSLCTSWTLGVVRPLSDADVAEITRDLLKADSTLACDVQIADPASLRLRFKWDTYDADALIRSASAIVIAERRLGVTKTIEGRPRPDWPITDNLAG